MREPCNGEPSSTARPGGRSSVISSARRTTRSAEAVPDEMQLLRLVSPGAVDQPTHVIAHRADGGRIGKEQRPQRAVRLQPAPHHEQFEAGLPQAVHQDHQGGRRVGIAQWVRIHSDFNILGANGERGDAMLSRRAFLERGSLALAAMSLQAARAAEAQTGPLGRPIGLQLYTIRDAVAKDLAGTLRAIAEIGYREVELAGIPAGATAGELRRMLGDNGLTAPSMHASMADLQTGCRSASTTRRGSAANTSSAPSRGLRTRASATTPATRSCRSPRASRSTTGSGTPSSSTGSASWQEGRTALRLSQSQHGVPLVQRRGRLRRAAAPDRSEAGHDGDGHRVGRDRRRRTR